MASMLGFVVLVAGLALFAVGGRRVARSDTDDRMAQSPASLPASATPGAATIATVQVPSAASGPRVARSFIGLSIEYWAVGQDMGLGTAPDPLLARLVSGLGSGGGPPTLRIGGRSTDESWWNPSDRPQPQGITYDITPAWLTAMRKLMLATRAQTLLGLNLELGRPSAAAAWARAAARVVPARQFRGFEIGNEPDLFPIFAYYGTRASAASVKAGAPALVRHYSRGSGYGLTQFTSEFRRSALAVRHVVPKARLIGPGLSTLRWMGQLPQFLNATTGLLSAVTLHRYAVQSCHSGGRRPTIGTLLTSRATDQLAQRIVPYVAEARAQGLPFAVTEFNSIACKGRPGVSNSFGAALWGLDTLFAMANAGVSNVDLHTRPDASYSAYHLTRHGRQWTAHVAPIYYALRLFGQETPADTRVSPVPVAGHVRLRAWALRSGHGRGQRLRVVVIDEDPHAHGNVRLQLPGRGAAQAIRLDAPSLHSSGRTTLAGQSYGPDARLHGARRVTRIVPAAGSGTYTVSFTRPGVVVLTLAAR